jgi:hypothetical protein
MRPTIHSALCPGTRARILPTLLLVLSFQVLSVHGASAQTPSPEAFFGFRMGTDGRLASWPDMVRYFEEVAAQSDRVELVDIGLTTEGNRMIAALVSAPANIRNLPAIQAANRRLANPANLVPEEAAALAATQKAVVAIGCSIHATEIGATQAANELLFTLATSTDPETVGVLEQVVLVLIPSLNPDGHRLVVDWYDKHRGTEFDGGPMPWLYHKYAGHDLNRDAFMLNMVENRNLARFFYTVWHPQVFLTMHEMGARGPRFFVPPNYDPIDPNYDPLIWRQAGLLGHAMALSLEQDNRSGVVQNAMFDYYWPGYEDSAPLGHNTVCLLSEVASVRIASAMTISSDELTGSPRGLPEYRQTVNFPNPWPGGTWRLRDIVDYNLSAVRGLLLGTARYRETLVGNFYRMGRRAIEAGKKGGPFAYLVPPDQHDPHATARLTNTLIDSAVEVDRALEPFRADGEVYPEGTTIIFMAQPFRAFVKTLLERQDYPARRSAPGAAPERPYDVAGWTLPFQMGVKVRAIEQSFEPPAMARLDRAAISPAPVWGDRRPSYFLVDTRGNGGAIVINRALKAGVEARWLSAPLELEGYQYPAGSLLINSSRAARAVVETAARDFGLRATGGRGRMPQNARRLHPVRVGLYKPWVDSIDEGWTRWLLEQFEFPFRSLSDADIRRGSLRTELDAVILPDLPPDRLVSGHAPGTIPQEYTGGLGREGVEALVQFVQAGGTLVTLDSSGGLAIDALGLPLRDAARDASSSQFFCPGSILRLTLDPTQPLSFGLPPETAGVFAYSAAYEIRPETTETAQGHAGGQVTPNLQVVARYGASDVLMSGWLQGESVIANRAAVVDARVGLGRAVLIGFRAQHRGQSLATFRLLFNAIFTAR